MAAGAPPQTPLDRANRVLHTVGEDGDEGKDEFASNLNFLTMPLWWIWIAPKASFLIWNAPKSLAAGAPPQTPLDDLTAFYTLLERIEMREKMNLPPISISWLRHCSSLNLNRTKSFLFDLKCPKIVNGWGSAPGPVGGAYSAPQIPWLGWVEGMKFVSLLSCWGCLAVPQSLLEGNNIITLAIIKNCPFFNYQTVFRKSWFI